MMKLKKRRKNTRYRGSQTHFRGHRRRTRGSGNQGGVGMAGTGKRGDQKKTLVIKLFGNDYFGRDKALRRGTAPKKLETINLNEIIARLDSLVKQGKAKESKGAYELNLEGYKVLGDGELKQKLIIKASAASNSAIEKIKKAGGSIQVEKEEEKEEKPEEPKEASK